MSRLASNNQMTLEDFIVFIEENGDSYEELREQMRREMRIQRIQRGRVNSRILLKMNLKLSWRLMKALEPLNQRF